MIQTTEASSQPLPAFETHALPTAVSSRITIPEIAERLAIGRQAVYAMLEQRIIPAIRLGKRWIVTRHAYENWERSAGTSTAEVLQ
jgi:excisionase family DNA binding protein